MPAKVQPMVAEGTIRNETNSRENLFRERTIFAVPEIVCFLCDKLVHAQHKAKIRMKERIPSIRPCPVEKKKAQA